ncbi:hypothetical protein ABPG75_009293 [Micractinium tetrahymenae]
MYFGPHLTTAASCAAATAAARQLLRLAALLGSRQANPLALWRGSASVTQAMIRLVSAARTRSASSAAATSSASRALPPDADDCRFFESMVKLAGRLCNLPGAGTDAPTSGIAEAAFRTLGSACRLVHAMAAALGAAPAGSSGSSTAALFQELASPGAVLEGSILLQNAARAALLAPATLLDCPGLAARQAETVQRRHECSMLLYLAALEALRSAPVQQVLAALDPANRDAAHFASCVALSQQLRFAPELRSLWGQLLAEPGSPALDTLLFYALRGMQVAATGVRQLPLGIEVNSRDVLQLLQAAVEVGGLAVVKAYRQDRGLLAELASFGAWLNSEAEYEREGLVLLWVLLNELTGSAVAIGSSFSSVEMQRKLEEVAQLASSSALAPTWSSVQATAIAATSTPATAASEAVGPLAVRRARALAEAGCSNPRCANLAAPGRPRRCSGCMVVRYCSPQCKQEDWQQHRPACRLLRQHAPGSP